MIDWFCLLANWGRLDKEIKEYLAHPTNSPKPHLLQSLHSSFTQNWRRHSSLTNPILIHPLSPCLPLRLNFIHGVNLVRSLGVVNPVAEMFDSNRKNFRFSRKIKFPIFQPKILTTFLLVVNSKNWLSSVQNRLELFQDLFTTTLQPLEPHDPPAKNLGVATLPTPRIDAYVYTFDIVLVKCLWISWFPRLRFWGHCKNIA